MKHVRRILAFALTFVMALAIVPTALAQTENANMTGGTGSITINNAAKGETYAVYKLFDATYDNSDPNNKKIAYSGVVPESLKDYFDVDDAGNVTAKNGIRDLNATAQEALKDWAATQTAVISAVSDGSTLVFTSLKYGYYVVTTTQGDQAISVDSVNPDVTINDKNTYTITAEKTVNGTSYSIGDTITYTATFGTANYVGEGDDAKIVTKYEIKDTLPEFLTSVNVTSITVGGESITTQQFNNKIINIEWATENDDGSYTSKYTNGAEIVIVYSAVLTNVVNINTGNKNTVTITPYVPSDTGDDEEPWNRSWSDETEIKTYAAALKKTDGTGPLAGAQFTIKGLTVTGSNGVYTVQSYDPRPNAEDSAVLDTNSDGKLYIIGLKEGVSLTVTEFKAPNGYNKLIDTVTLNPQVMDTKIYKESGTIYYDAKGNVVSQESNAEEHVTVTANLTDLDANAVVVVNNQGTELPSTGGIGTTIFYIVGGVMVAGAVIFLLTKRRVNAE